MTTKLANSVQPYPQAVKTETTNPEADAVKSKPATTRVFPIYAQGNICGYYYANKNVILPQKVALPNIGSSFTQTLPNTQIGPPLREPIKVTQTPPQTMTPQFLATLNTLLQRNKTMTPVINIKNPLPLPRTVHTCPMMRTVKSDPKPLKPVSILPAPVKLMPVTIPNNVRLRVTTDSNDLNKPNTVPILLVPVGRNLPKNNFLRKENQNGNIVTLVSPETLASEKQVCNKEIEDYTQKCKSKIPTWHSPLGCNVQNNNSQLTFPRSENENRVSLTCPKHSSSRKRACDTEIEGSKKNCKLKKTDQTEPASDSPSEKEQSKTENVNQKNGLLAVPAPDVNRKKRLLAVPAPDVNRKKRLLAVPAPDVNKKNGLLAVPPPDVNKKNSLLAVPAPDVNKKNSLLAVPAPDVNKKNGLLAVPPPDVNKKNGLLAVPPPDVNQKNGLLAVPAPDVNQKNSLLAVPAPDVKTEITDADLNSVCSETELENNYGLVISSCFSLSEVNASELGVAFENVS